MPIANIWVGVQRQHGEARRAWASSLKSEWPDEQTYVNEIQPRLARVTISRLSSTLSVSEPYAADIRAGRRQPHHRHWRSLAKLVAFGVEYSLDKIPLSGHSFSHLLMYYVVESTRFEGERVSLLRSQER